MASKRILGFGRTSYSLHKNNAMPFQELIDMTTELHGEDRELLVALRAEGLPMEEISRLLGKTPLEAEYEQLNSSTDRSGFTILIDWLFPH